MDWLNITFGAVGLFAFLFSIYSHFATQSKKTIEAAKFAMMEERFRNIHLTVSALAHTIDSIVQLPKKGPVTVEQLQHIARDARVQAFIVQHQIGAEFHRMKTWRFGEVVRSSEEKEKEEAEPVGRKGDGDQQIVQV
jgi:hypothetical protein